ncbi:hypothetical protein [Zavarzinia sp. CC-PAN008]|uniref:hypothetical protein n=1 Tax=Zavarzinia sp. CC-PAN008 TaxID=3243332 RepID=UPI003F744DED
MTAQHRTRSAATVLLLALALGACANGQLGAFATSAAPEPAAAPAAQPAEAGRRIAAPVWKPGSSWQYSDGYGLQVEARSGLLTTFRRLDDPGQWVTRRGFLREDSQSATTLRKIVFEDLPATSGLVLTAGEPLTYTREYSAAGIVRKHVTSWSIEGRERVKVPAGEFDCWIIVMRTRNAATGWTGYERWWFSPDVQNYVRMEYRYGTAPPGSRVLTAYALAR